MGSGDSEPLEAGAIELEGGEEARAGLLWDRGFPALDEHGNGCETIAASYEVLVRTGKLRLAGSGYSTVKGGSLGPSPTRFRGGETALAGSAPEKASAGVRPWSP